MSNRSHFDAQRFPVSRPPAWVEEQGPRPENATPRACARRNAHLVVGPQNIRGTVCFSVNSDDTRQERRLGSKAGRIEEFIADRYQGVQTVYLRNVYLFLPPVHALLSQ